MRDVQRRIPLSRSRIFELIAEGRFPRQVRLSNRASAWVEREIDEWMRQRLEARSDRAAVRHNERDSTSK
jgi:prophage regulatory protein